MVIFSYMYGIKYQILNKYQPPPTASHRPGHARPCSRTNRVFCGGGKQWWAWTINAKPIR